MLDMGLLRVIKYQLVRLKQSREMVMNVSMLVLTVLFYIPMNLEIL